MGLVFTEVELELTLPKFIDLVEVTVENLFLSGSFCPAAGLELDGILSDFRTTPGDVSDLTPFFEEEGGDTAGLSKGWRYCARWSLFFLKHFPQYLQRSFGEELMDLLT